MLLEPNTFSYLMVAVVMFAIGMIGVITRRNAIVVFMCIELMLNATNLVLVTFSKVHDEPSGSLMVFFVMCVAAAEAVVGLAIMIALFRNYKELDINELNLFKW